MAKLSGKQVTEAMSRVPKWQRKGREIRRTYEFKDLLAAVQFVSVVARAAQKAWHHPAIGIRSNKVTLALTTHDDGGLTEKDFALAEKSDALERGRKGNAKRKT